MLYDHLPSDRLLRELVNAAAQAGHHAGRDFYEAEQDLYSDPHMREAREMKEAILKRIEERREPAGEPTHVAGTPLPQSGLDLGSVGGKEF